MLSLVKSNLLQVLKIMFFKMARGDLGALHRATLRRMADGEVPALQQRLLYNAQHLMHGNFRTHELTQQLQTSNLELTRLQGGISHLRMSVGRNQSTEHRDAEISSK